MQSFSSKTNSYSGKQTKTMKNMGKLQMQGESREKARI